MSDYFPEEVLIKILNNLPTSSLIRCTSVCKSWYSLIKSPHFISTQIAKTSSIDLKTNPNPLLLFHIYAGKYSIGFDNEFKEYKSLPFPFRSGAGFLPAVGYSNGLLCLCQRDALSNRYKDTFILWNPSIRKSFSLPQPNFAFGFGVRGNCLFCSDFMGFGYDSNTNDYKVFRMMIHQFDCRYVVDEHQPIVQIEIYSLSTNSWKIITEPVPKYYRIRNRMPSQKHCVGGFLKNNNCLHWIVNCYSESEDIVQGGSCVIMVFDFNDEVFSEITLPDFFEDQQSFGWSVKAYRESSIGVVGRRNNSLLTHVWVMNNYGDEDSWKMLSRVDEHFRFLGFRNNGEIMYTYFDQQSKSPVEDAFMDNYVESLALLDKSN